VIFSIPLISLLNFQGAEKFELVVNELDLSEWYKMAAILFKTTIWLFESGIKIMMKEIRR
jgi:hypothetical protein